MDGSLRIHFLERSVSLSHITIFQLSGGVVMLMHIYGARSWVATNLQQLYAQVQVQRIAQAKSRIKCGKWHPLCILLSCNAFGRNHAFAGEGEVREACQLCGSTFFHSSQTVDVNSSSRSILVLVVFSAKLKHLRCVYKDWDLHPLDLGSG